MSTQSKASNLVRRLIEGDEWSDDSVRAAWKKKDEEDTKRPVPDYLAEPVKDLESQGFKLSKVQAKYDNKSNDQVFLTFGYVEACLYSIRSKTLSCRLTFTRKDLASLAGAKIIGSADSSEIIEATTILNKLANEIDARLARVDEICQDV